MTNENDLIQKLMISKKIMEKHNNIPRSSDITNFNNTISEESVPNVQYNLPEEYNHETKIEEPKIPTKDRILSSKLPDEIKKLMIEHPIVPHNPMSSPTISDEIVNKAARLMNSDASGKQIIKNRPKEIITENFLKNNNFRETLKEVLTEVLIENGVISESVEKTNETLSFKIGNHIFEGKITKIKKLK